MILENVLNTPLLQLVAGFGYLLGHLLLSRKQIGGWMLKIVGGSAWTVFLFQNQNYIFMAVTIVIVLSMFYGWYKWHTGEHDKRTPIDIFFEILAAIVAVTMIGRFAISGVFEVGPMLETIIVIAEISGTILLARKILAGWYAYIVMSALAGILVIFVNPNPAIVLGMLEMGSIYFYLKGIRHFGSVPIDL